MRTVTRLSAGLLAAVALTVGFIPGASAAEPGRTAPTKPLPWEASHVPTGAGEFTTLCGGLCPHKPLPLRASHLPAGGEFTTLCGGLCPDKPLPWEASHISPGAGEFAILCSGGCIK